MQDDNNVRYIGVQLLGLGGYALSGKDTVADVLESRNWYRTYMSEPLERALLALDPYISGSFSTRYSYFHSLLGYTKSKENPEVRRLLQKLGTDVGRNILGENVWVNAVFDNLPEYRQTVVTGIRYPNELAKIRELDGLAAWVRRPGFGPVNDHSSDNSLTADDFDFVIENDGTIYDLVRKVEGFFV